MGPIDTVVCLRARCVLNKKNKLYNAQKCDIAHRNILLLVLISRPNFFFFRLFPFPLENLEFCFCAASQEPVIVWLDISCIIYYWGFSVHFLYARSLVKRYDALAREQKSNC